VTTAKNWIAFPDALKRADAAAIDQHQFLSCLIADLAAPDTDAVARGLSRLTERRYTTVEEERSKAWATEQLNLLFRTCDEFSPDFPQDMAHRLRTASHFEPPAIFHLPSSKYEIHTDFWAHCGPMDEQGQSYWADDPEEPRMWTKVTWHLGQASCCDVLPGTLWSDGDGFGVSTAYWEFTDLEITSKAVERAIRKLDFAGKTRREELILSLGPNYTKGWSKLKNDPAFMGFTKESFIEEWLGHRPKGKRGRRPQAR
jgi:hypothetical protein